MDPTLDGQNVLGTACHVVVMPSPRATQRDDYCGQNGFTILDGGSRGGRFRITGLLVAAPDEDGGPSGVIQMEETLKSFFDGNTHVLVDTQGREFDSVYLTGEGYSPDPDGPVLSDQGWCLPYTLSGESTF